MFSLISNLRNALARLAASVNAIADLAEKAHQQLLDRAGEGQPALLENDGEQVQKKGRK